jgi:hypothetical protein
VSLLFVSWCSAALYESWAMPVASAGDPVRRIRRVSGSLLRSFDNNVYTQIG